MPRKAITSATNVQIKRNQKFQSEVRFAKDFNTLPYSIETSGNLTYASPTHQN